MTVVLPTFDELRARIRSEIQLRQPKLTDFTEGSVLDAISGGAAVLGDESIRVNVDLFSEHFFDTAEGAALDALAADRGFPPRKLAVGAVGSVLWTKDDAGAAYTIPSGTLIEGTVEGVVIQVATTSTAVLSATDVSIAIPAQATITGRGTNFPANTLDTVAAPLVADPGATVTNPVGFAGGADAETDDQYRDRLRRFFNTLRRGTVAALEFGSLLVPGVSFATVDESTVPESEGGFVSVYVGDPDARSNDTLAALVVESLEDFRAAGVLVIVLGADREEVTLALTLTVLQGADTAQVGEDVRANILGYTDNLKPNETLRLSRIDQTAHEASELVRSVAIVSPTADVAPTLPQNAIRVNETDISLVFVEE